MIRSVVVASPGYQVARHHVSGPAMAVAALAVALLAVAPPAVWRWSRLGVTAVHESGHAIVALLVGRKVTAIHLRPDSSGVTIHYGRGGWARRFATAAAGYPAPGILGVAGAFLVDHRELQVWLVALLALGMVNVVLWIRNLFGFVVMTGWIGAVGWLIFRGTSGIDALVSSVAVWYLVLGGVRAATEVPRAPAASDAADMGKLLHLPNALCKAGFVIVGGAAVFAAAKVLSTTAR